MICVKHKKTYTGSCPDCDKAAQAKEENLRALGPKYQPRNWKDNAAYDGGRRYRPEFRSKVQSALTFLTRAYGGKLDKTKLKDLDNALRGNLDDVFAVSGDDAEWTNVVHALGGLHGDAVYGTDGRLLGIMQSFGCTTYSRIDVDAEKTAGKDDYTSMMGFLNDSKRIYLHGTGVDLSTVVHEMLHYFCHQKFYTAFAADGVGPEWKTLNEGITEYLTRLAYGGEHHGSYQMEFEKVQILLKAGLTKDSVESAYFMGQIQELVDKMKAGETNRDNLPTDERMDKVLAGRRGRRGGQGGPQPGGSGQVNQ